MAGHDDAGTGTGTGPTAQEPPTDDVTARASGSVLVVDEPLAEELLVEEISIDGMCGVY